MRPIALPSVPLEQFVAQLVLESPFAFLYYTRNRRSDQKVHGCLLVFPLLAMIHVLLTRGFFIGAQEPDSPKTLQALPYAKEDKFLGGLYGNDFKSTRAAT
jgi:hypothetical protein